ncbi:DNA recombination protein RmuC [Sulfurimonas sp.]|jgi:DNA recombination protein RmuC|uniref:DNA recombination protein RmuC n=1 Tax=Sulfurimonas sp. TaxID=2022749 RepID=UPI002A3603E9|nr:DNA recombination protein RmuC [Sulfurimonas sp.]MDY0122738.1 DNA recombination protein RmuC [Sulfurimonas sp.]
MVEAVYVGVGLLFGIIGVWIAVVQTLKNQLHQEKENSAALLSQNAVLQERIEGINEKNREKFELLEQNREQMRLEFQELAQKILENNSQKFSLQNQESISKMIAPIREQFSEFKKQIDDVYIKEAKDRSMLQAEIRSIKEINHQMSKDAKNLTKALKGESKKQGVWGEMVLESVLESSGLRLGKEYEREVSLEHESDGSRYRPDVLVHLPENRDIIIDAKTSLTAYERYASAESEEQKEHFAIEHLSSMKKHIKELSDKDYTNLKGIKTLDFIFMFIPIESALLMAMEYDGSLFDHAFKRNVILVGPTTLMVSLRAVENSWKYERQQKNAQEIAKRAGLLFDKFAGFIESVEKLGNQITTVQKTYDETFSKLHSGSGSITSQFQKLQKLGAANSKNLPQHMLED